MDDNDNEAINDFLNNGEYPLKSRPSALRMRKSRSILMHYEKSQEVDDV